MPATEGLWAVLLRGAALLVLREPLSEWMCRTQFTVESGRTADTGEDARCSQSIQLPIARNARESPGGSTAALAAVRQLGRVLERALGDPITGHHARQLADSLFSTQKTQADFGATPHGLL